MLLGAAALATGMAPSAAVAAASARTCSAPKYPGSGYFTSLMVQRTSCATGKKVALAYYRCRIRRGKAGRCTARVLGYRCSEKRIAIPTEIDARVTCRRDRVTITHTYQQNI